MNAKYTEGPWSVGGKYAQKTVLLNAIGESIASGGNNRAVVGAELEASLLLASFAPQMLTDLQEAAKTLRHYEALHRAKNTEESTKKADVNAALAARFEATITKATGGAA